MFSAASSNKTCIGDKVKVRNWPIIDWLVHPKTHALKHYHEIHLEVELLKNHKDEMKCCNPIGRMSTEHEDVTMEVQVLKERPSGGPGRMPSPAGQEEAAPELTLLARHSWDFQLLELSISVFWESLHYSVLKSYQQNKLFREGSFSHFTVRSLGKQSLRRT